MSTIVLITDFGSDSVYPGIMKGVIRKISSDSEIIDLNHNLSPHSIQEGVFILRKSYSFFPENSIFVGVIDPEVGSNRRIVCLCSKKMKFLLPDNGLGECLKSEDIDNAYEITNKDLFLKPLSDTFHGRDIFAPIAAHLANGIALNKIGKEINPSSIIRKNLLPSPDIVKGEIEGRVIYTDSFGNLITNIDIGLLQDKTPSLILNNSVVITGLSSSYSDVPINEGLLIINSFGTMEIAVNQGSALAKYKLKNEAKIKLKINY